MPFTFAVVHFVESNEVDVVPISWIKDGACFWPPLKVREARKLSKKVTLPAANWLAHPIKVLGKYETFEEAVRRLRKAEETSDLNTTDPEEECGRGKRKQMPKQWSGSEEEPCSLTFTERTGIVAPPFEPDYGTDHENGHSYVPSDPTPNENVTMMSVINTAQIADIESAILSLGQEVSSLRKDVGIVKEMQRLIISNQEVILNKLCASQSTPAVTSEQVALPFSLPIESMQDLYAVENALQNRSVVEHLTERLAVCGGATVDATVRRILVKVINNDVAQNFSWLGARGKQVFSKLHLAEVIFDATRRNAVLGNTCTDLAIENAVKNWLRHAKARHLTKLSEIEKNSQSLI